LWNTDLIRADNAEKWVNALMKINTLTELDLDGVGEEIVEQLKTKTKGRSINLDIY